jgi:hypothetical protein
MVSASPQAPIDEPASQGFLIQIYYAIGDAEMTIGWYNKSCLISLNESISLLETLEPSFNPGSTDLTKCQAAIDDIRYIIKAVEDIESTDELIDPEGAEVVRYKDALVTHREWIGGLIIALPPEIPEWYEDIEMLEERKTRGDELKEKWMRYREKPSESTGENGD